MSIRSVVIALLLTVSAIGLALAGVSAGVWIYAAVALAAAALSRGGPDRWPGCMFEGPRVSLAHRLLTQLAALVCLLLAQCLRGDLRDILSVAGILLFLHALLVACVPRIGRVIRR